MIVRFLTLFILWLFLTSLEPKSIIMGIVALFLTFSLSGFYIRRLNLVNLAIFIPVFVKEALIAGLDVFVRIITGKVDPGFVKYRVRNKSALKPLAVFITLTPGTMSVKLQGQEILIHTINLKGINKKSIRKMEILFQRVLS